MRLFDFTLDLECVMTAGVGRGAVEGRRKVGEGFEFWQQMNCSSSEGQEMRVPSLLQCAFRRRTSGQSLKLQRATEG